MKKGKFWYSYKAKVLLYIINVLSFYGIFVGIIGTGIHEFLDRNYLSNYDMADLSVQYKIFEDVSYDRIAGIIRIMKNTGIPILVVSIILFVITTIAICLASGHRVDSDEIKLTWFDRIPYLIVFSILVTIISVNPNIAFDTEYFYELSLEMVIVVTVALSAFFYASCVALVLTTIVRIKAKKFYETSLLHQFNRFVRFLSDKTGFPKAILGVRDYWRANNRFVVRFTVLLGLFTLVEFPFFRSFRWFIRSMVSV